jgi:ABC-type multidrug transport system permease subunit
VDLYAIFFKQINILLGRYLSYVLPQTFACEAMRGVLSRGWGAEWEPVYRGLLVTLAWIVVLLALSAIILRARR